LGRLAFVEKLGDLRILPGWVPAILLIWATGFEGFLQEGIEGGARKAVAGQLQEGSGQGLTGGGAQGGVASAQFLLLSDGSEKPFRHIPLGAGADDRVLLELVQERLGVELLQASVEAVEDFLGFLGDMGELPVREAGQIGHIDLAMIPQG
jgi:hypothetical protein